jgi:hypothetical protein
MSGRAWTEEERAVVRLRYRRKGAAWCASQLPGRSAHAVRAEARALGVAVDARWTQAECAVLLREWGDVGERTLRKMLPHRSWCGIAQKAKKLGLGDPAQGRSSLDAIMTRTGLCRRRLERVLREAGVPIALRPRTSTPRQREQSHRWLAVAPDLAVEAVEAWLARGGMTVRAAAEHCGCDRGLLRRALHQLAATRPVEGMGAGPWWSITAADAEEALRLYQQTVKARRIERAKERA